MIKIIKLAIVGILMTLTVYFSVAFIEAEIDCTKWDKGQRSFVVFVSIVVSFFSMLGILIAEND
jgi:hypothetical protein